MFDLIADESTQNLGIEVHKKRKYIFETDFLAGVVWHDSTDKKFFVGIEPNYNSLKDLTHKEADLSAHKHFNAARSQTIAIGQYKTIDVVQMTIDELEKWFIHVLERHGAAHHYLRQQDNYFKLVEDDTASTSKLGDAIMQALGVQGYGVSQDLSPDAHGEVRFILENVCVFSIYKPQKEGGPAYLERYSYQHGDYFRTFAGEATGDVVKKIVFEWLIDAAQEHGMLTVSNPEAYLDRLALDVRKSWIDGSSKVEEMIFENKGHPSLGPSDNVLKLGEFRPR